MIRTALASASAYAIAIEVATSLISSFSLLLCASSIELKGMMAWPIDLSHQRILD